MSFLTPRQREVLEYIRVSIAERGVAPTLREIAEAFGFSTTASAQKHVALLESKGFLRRVPNQKRGLELVQSDSRDADVVHLPLLGVVAAGAPVEALQVPETLEVPGYLIGPGEHYVLRVRGDSMIGDGIHDGDLIVIARRTEVRDGDAVVALVDGEVTLKRLFRRPGGVVVLQPANPSLPPIQVSGASVTVQGVVTALLRRYG